MSVENQLASPKGRWQDRAACKDLPTDVTVGPDEEGKKQKKIREKYVIGNYCLGCKVVANCLGEALEQRETYGVKGGTSETDREKYFDKKITREELEVSGVKKVYGKAAAQVVADGLTRMREARAVEAALAAVPIQREAMDDNVPSAPLEQVIEPAA